MTINICIVCGEIGAGILIPCRKCNYTPKTGWEIGFAAYNSDHSMSREPILATSSRFKERFSASKPVWLKFSDSDQEKLLHFLREPSGRDILELRRGARSSFLKKQVNFHFIGPDGYESQIVTRGRELTKTAFDSIKTDRDDNAFLIRTYLSGERHDSEIPKDLWYAVKDHFNLMDRLNANEGRMLSTISAHARHYTGIYLASKGLDLRES